MFRSEEEFKKIIDKAKVDTRPDPVYRQKLRQQMLLTFEAQKRKPDAPETLAFETKQSIIIKLKDRLTTMKNITKIAAALIIVTGIVGMIFIFSTGKPSFARIVEPLFNARTVTFKLTVQIERQPAQTLETMFMEPGLMRQTMPDGSIQTIFSSREH